MTILFLIKRYILEVVLHILLTHSETIYDILFRGPQTGIHQTLGISIFSEIGKICDMLLRLKRLVWGTSVRVTIYELYIRNALTCVKLS